MKRTAFILSAFCIILFLTSCRKEDYSVRFKNDYKEAINNVAAGNATLGRIEPGKVSDYQKFTGHSFMIAGTADSGLPLSGSESVSGKGTHKWTITLNSDGKIDFAEDPL